MLVVEEFHGTQVMQQRVEMVERKGTGHPDQICDCIMDSISVALSQAYLAEFGTILHHNIDKGLLAAGRVGKRFGGGEVLEPMELTIGDRATFTLAGKEIPVHDIAVAAAKGWIAGNLRHVDPERHVTYRLKLAPGSQELTDIFARPGEVRGANDTSAAVGYYPLSPTERAVLTLERELNSGRFKALFPETGEDVKVMGLRNGKELDLTVAMPLLAERITSERDYFERKHAVETEMQQFLAGGCRGFERVRVHYNTLDQAGRGLNGVYLSLLGTSAEDADSGQVGRGNRVNGLIPIARPIGTEAAAGKNPMSHVGKIYNVLSHRIAREICKSVAGVQGAYVMLLSRIGDPVDRPQMANAQLVMEPGRSVAEVEGEVREVMQRQFSGITEFCYALARGAYPVC
ncbi:methionine adenosyltransferase [Geomonas sp. Red69]|uniref:Methionine adenosyltransferase n=1 Tax=Geomonas diazotrophica TaxID=2843197 RepID=A0ABX8JJ22_9BACT|nr:MULTISPECIES: methionine adenosyltransferase [Geomonas]MBU5636813.1 methionine adenosyltransferase [Geomonas diazotrophica]QWV98378.1 methionine adenosyltransferase [Geomonas nitrogeniifigens]QXE87560.1 methionine adenosyltransferase [Geomonas nitrogeniifigens]